MTDTIGERTLALIEDAGAVYRLTKLVTADALTEGLRDRIIDWSRQRLLSTGDEIVVSRRYGPEVAEAGGPLAYLVGCPWCASVWLAAGVALARRAAPLPWALAARALTMSAATGWLSERD